MTTIKKATPQNQQSTVSKASTQVSVNASTPVSVDLTPKKPGRPKGSKNKVKVEAQGSTIEKGTNSDRYEEAKKTNFVPITVSQILGEDVRDKFGTSDEEDYHRKICAMSRREIFYHASQLGVPLNESLLRLRKNLLAEFRKHVSTFKVPKNSGTVIGTVPKKSNLLNRKIQTVQEFKDAPEKIQEILDEVK